MQEIKTISLPKMLSIKQAAEEAKISRYFVRKLIYDKKIIFVKSGAKFYVNFGSLINYLNTGIAIIEK